MVKEYSVSPNPFTMYYGTGFGGAGILSDVSVGAGGSGGLGTARVTSGSGTAGNIGIAFGFCDKKTQFILSGYFSNNQIAFGFLDTSGDILSGYKSKKCITSGFVFK